MEVYLQFRLHDVALKQLKTAEAILDRELRGTPEQTTLDLDQ